LSLLVTDYGSVAYGHYSFVQRGLFFKIQLESQDYFTELLVRKESLCTEGIQNIMECYLLPQIISLAALEVLDQLWIEETALLFLKTFYFLAACNQLKHTIKIVMTWEEV
jgi:hypothetical protein